MSWNNFCAFFPFSLICVIIISQDIYTNKVYKLVIQALLLASTWGDFGQVRLLANKRSSNLSATESESCPSWMCIGYQTLKTIVQQPSNPFSEGESCCFFLTACFVCFYFLWVYFVINECSTKSLESKSGHCSFSDQFSFSGYSSCC